MQRSRKVTPQRNLAAKNRSKSSSKNETKKDLKKEKLSKEESRIFFKRGEKSEKSKKEHRSKSLPAPKATETDQQKLDRKRKKAEQITENMRMCGVF